jgi:hypothetical protein
MYTQQVSVYELKKYWKTADALAEGDSMDVIPLCYMPPWNNLCSELGWRLHRAAGGYFSKKHHGHCGVYRLIGLAAEGDLKRPATLNRVCGQDTTGTLYIGESGSLNTRLNQLRRTLKSREASHNAISMLRSIPLLKLKFSPNKLAIALLFTGRNTRFVESNLIEAYMNSFGDTPPLNYRL